MSVEIHDETLEIPTYVWGPPDPNPPFQRRGGWRIYPYPLLDDLGEEARPVRYRALVVENEYLRVTVLPELGGRLYSAVDRESGEEIFYRNNVVKAGLIALRGAWISGGIEWNFPRGHTVTTVSPVDAIAVEEEDGSAAIWVGNVEQIHRMAWAVGIRLRPGSSVIETDICLRNPTSLPHPYYFWANAAVPARDDMHMIYPGTRAFTWRLPEMSWPVHEGRDMSRYVAFESANDVFIVDSLEGFFGVYYEERDFGVVHFASPHESFGKKFFTWGTAHHGRMWSAALSDEEGPYCEIQSGRFVDQSIWRLLPPHHTERWTERWYPVKGTGVFSWANEEAAVRLGRRNGDLECGAIVSREVPGALVEVMAAGRAVIRERTDLSPDRPFRRDIARGTAGAGPATLVVCDAKGREIIRYAEGQAPRTVSVQREPKRHDGTAGELAGSALRAEESGDIERAWELYERALGQDAGCAAAAVALGRLAIERRPEEAVERLERAVTAAPESADAAYYLGVALSRAERDGDAETELRRAGRQPAFCHAARVELAMGAMRRGEWARAVAALRSGLDYDAASARARGLLAAALRRAGLVKDALREAEIVRRTCPADRFARAEMHFCAAAQGRPRVAARALRELAEMMPAEPDPWLDLALDYAAPGMVEEAASLLAWAGKRVRAVREHPLTHYLAAHLHATQGKADEAAAEGRLAAERAPQYVFPHHWEMERALEGRLRVEPEDARARYYLGLLLYSQGRRAEGLAHWRDARRGLGDFPVLHRSLAFAHREVEGDLDSAEEALRRAIRANPEDARLYLELDEVLRERGAGAGARLEALDSAPERVQRRGAVAAQQITCCLALEDWDRAASLLAGHIFHRWEMEFRMRRLYVEAYVGRGIARFDGGDLDGARKDFEQALEYPENVRIGRPAHPADARAHWGAGIACEALGDAAAARKHWEGAAAESYHHAGDELTVFRALSLAKLGRAEEAGAVFEEALEVARECADAAPEDAMAQFSLGLVLRAMGRDGEAEGALRRALAVDPAMRRARRLLEERTVL